MLAKGNNKILKQKATAQDISKQKLKSSEVVHVLELAQWDIQIINFNI